MSNDIHEALSGPKNRKGRREGPDVAAVVPDTIESVLAGGVFTPGQFEVVTVRECAELRDAALLDKLASTASRGVLIVDEGGIDVRPARPTTPG